MSKKKEIETPEKLLGQIGVHLPTGYYCLIAGSTHQLILMPVKSIGDIGNGAGMGLKTTPEELAIIFERHEGIIREQ